MRIPMLGRAALLTLPLLAACGENPMRTFGFSRDAPDEFQVTTRAPLSMPPEYGLRPPQPGVRRPQEQTPREAAEAALTPQVALQQPRGRGRPAEAAVTSTRGESALLAAAGPAAPADIRGRVSTEQTALNAVDTSFADKLIFWRAAPEPGTVVDPTREAQRIRENSALGQQATTGDTPIIQRRRPGLLEGLL